MHKVKNLSFLATCPQLMEETLAKELDEIGIDKYKLTKEGILFGGDPIKALELLLRSRVASRVYLEIAHFDFTDEKDLYRAASKVHWTKHMNTEQTFKIETILHADVKQDFKNTIYLSQVCKDALVDQFRNEFDERPNVQLKRPTIHIIQYISKGKEEGTHEASFKIDLCGYPLSNRGYRQTGHRAPVRENIAAGVLMNTNWNPEEDLLIDPMCGSGTFLIESALYKARIPAAYLRILELKNKKAKPFAFMMQNWFHSDKVTVAQFFRMIDEMIKEVETKLDELPEGQFFGYDIDKDARTEARRSIQNSLLPDVIKIKEGDARTLECPGEAPGMIMTNPPYGVRLEEKEDLGALYEAFGENLKNNFKGFRAYLFTSAIDMRGSIRLKTSERKTFFNGNLECRLWRYDLF